MISLDTKHPYESYPVYLDFNPVLFGDTVSDFTIVAVDDQGNAISSIYTNLGESSGIGTLRIKAGADRKQYKFTATITQSDNSVNETDFWLDVNKKRNPVLVKPFQTGESRIIGIYFTDLLQGQLIDGVAFECTDLSTGNSADIFTTRGFDPDRDLVAVRIHDLNSDNKDYILYAIVTDNATVPNVYVEELYISVRNV